MIPDTENAHVSVVRRVPIRKEIYTPPLIRIEEIIKNKLPQLAIIIINVVMLSSFEFLSISAYITIVLITITEVLGLKET